MSLRKKLLPLLSLTAMVASSTQDIFYTAGHKRADKVESPEDRERRERCEQMAIEKAKAKRERKALKLVKNKRKEE